MKTSDLPLLRAGDWSWDNVKSGLRKYLEKRGILEESYPQLDHRYYLTGETDRNSEETIYLNSTSERVEDRDLNVPIYADIDGPDGYREKVVEFQLDVTYDHLVGDSLEFREINVREEAEIPA